MTRPRLRLASSGHSIPVFPDEIMKFWRKFQAIVTVGMRQVTQPTFIAGHYAIIYQQRQDN
jgi:hypothetical protein